jgi:hypothetical protein
MDAECILMHPDYQTMTYKTVLKHVGPLLKDKEGKRYRKRNKDTLKTSKT